MSLTEALIAFWPLLVFQLVVMVWALVDISHRERTRYLSRTVWMLIIILGTAVGPIVYFLLGRKD